MKQFIFLGVAALVLAFIVVQALQHQPIDRNVPGSTTGAGKKTLVD